MAKKATTNKKPPGFAEFDKVCRGLLAVPKTELVEQLGVREKRKRRKVK